MNWNARPVTQAGHFQTSLAKRNVLASMDALRRRLRMFQPGLSPSLAYALHTSLRGLYEKMRFDYMMLRVADADSVSVAVDRLVARYKEVEKQLAVTSRDSTHPLFYRLSGAPLRRGQIFEPSGDEDVSPHLLATAISLNSRMFPRSGTGY